MTGAADVRVTTRSVRNRTLTGFAGRRDTWARRQRGFGTGNPSNFPPKVVVWNTRYLYYRLQSTGFRFATAGGAAEVVPIVVKGVLYLSTQTRVAALDPQTGSELWSYDVPGGRASPRGVAYWPGDRQNPMAPLVWLAP